MPLWRPLLDVASYAKARAGSVVTVKVYQREAHRLLLWLQYECRGATLAQMSVADCSAFMAFLQNIPPRWISWVRAAPGQVGWAPFRGPLSHAGCRQAITIIASLFAWLQSAQYLSANPWVLVNQATGDDPGHKMLDTKALSEAAMAEVLRFVDAQAPSPSRAQIRFTLLFVEAVGLRLAELLSATLGDLRMESEGLNGWVLQVRGLARTCWRAAWTPWRPSATKRSTSMSRTGWPRQSWPPACRPMREKDWRGPRRTGCATPSAPGRLPGKCRSM